MGWNGSGTVTLLYDFSTDRDAGSPTNIIDADRVDAQLVDMAAAIQACINKNGENSPTTSVSWGSQRITSLGAATAANDAARARQVAENALQYGGTTGGSANAYTLSQTFVSTVATGTRLLCLANFSNTGAATLNVNGGGATSIKMQNGSTALPANAILSGYFFEVTYDGTNWRLLLGGLDIVGGSAIVPAAADGASVGTSSLPFSDVFLAAGGVINWNAGAFTITESGGELAFSGVTTFTNTGLHILDTNATHDLILKPGSNITADRTLTITTGDADRTLDISGGSVTITATAATVLDDATTGAMLTTLGAAASATTISAAGIASGGGDLSANRTITVTAAVQSDQETGTSTTIAVVPGVQKYHPSAVKVWCVDSGNGTTINASYNCTSLTDNGTGDVTVNFTTSFSSANFSCAATVGHGGNGLYTSTGTKASGSVQVHSRTNGATLTDPSVDRSIVCCGDQ